jgi:hypothetical protein
MRAVVITLFPLALGGVVVSMVFFFLFFLFFLFFFLFFASALSSRLPLPPIGMTAHAAITRVLPWLLCFLFCLLFGLTYQVTSKRGPIMELPKLTPPHPAPSVRGVTICAMKSVVGC